MPNMTWLQPPGYVHSMVTAAWQPNALAVQSGPYPASAQLSDDGSALTVQLVNSRGSGGSVLLRVNGFTPQGAATIWTLNSTDKGAGNTPAQPAAISPVKTTAAWPAAGLVVQLPMYSFVIVTATA